MGGNVFTLAGSKGGVGKTTTAVNLGVALQQAGYSTVVVDADLGMADLGRRLELDCRPGVHSVLADETDVRNAIVEGPAGVTVLSGGRDLEAVATARPRQLPSTLDLLSVAYDVVLVDTGPGIQQETMIAQRGADGTILVTTAQELAVQDTARTARLAGESDCPVVGVVVTRAEDERGAAEIADSLDTDLLAAIPRHPVSEGDPRTASAPESAAATAYHRLATALPVTDDSGRATPVATETDRDEMADQPTAAETRDDLL